MSSARPSSTLGAGRGERDRFAPDELAIVCSHYDIGVIKSIKEYRRGSRRAPKAVLKTTTGRYLLKRRAPGRDDPYKVAFCHGIQLHLAERRFPLPRLIGTSTENNSMLQIDGHWGEGGTHIYELFEFITGDSYDQSLDATDDAGRALAFFHKLLAHYKPDWEPPRGSFHGSEAVRSHLDMIPGRVGEARDMIDELTAAYTDAAVRVERLGFSRWPDQFIHGDWHPGNMLFRNSRVAAVLDFDSARLAPRIIDIANGALQFAITMRGDDPQGWPIYLDETRFKRFCRGYDSVEDAVISTAELEAMPWLMIEALISETAVPIATTGTFARIDGLAFLVMVRRKVRWIIEHADRLVRLISE